MENVRIRLTFANSVNLPLKHPRQCWILVQVSETKCINELQFRIVQKFGLSQDTNVRLWLDDCLLPSWEHCGVLRENDLIRQVTGHMTYFHHHKLYVLFSFYTDSTDISISISVCAK